MNERVSAAAGAIENLRTVGKIEGASYLVLLGVAMPLKYFAGLPQAVKVVGWAHGVLFVLLLVFLAIAGWRARLSVRQLLTVFVAALLPFGPFVIDQRLEREAAARANA